VYDDPGSYHYERLEATDVVTPEDARRASSLYLDRAVVLHQADTWQSGMMTASSHA
jgi:hypothetical protein